MQTVEEVDRAPFSLSFADPRAVPRAVRWPLPRGLVHRSAPASTSAGSLSALRTCRTLLSGVRLTLGRHIAGRLIGTGALCLLVCMMAEAPHRLIKA